MCCNARARGLVTSPFLLLKRTLLRIPGGASCSMQPLTDAIWCKSVTSLATDMQNPIRNQLKGKDESLSAITHRFKGGGHKHQGKDERFVAEQHLHSKGSRCREAGLCESVFVKQAVDCLHCSHSGLKSECFHLIAGNLLHSKLTPDCSQGWGLGLVLC